MSNPLSITFAFLANFANIALLGCSAWLITKAAEHPELAVLSVSVVGVRFFGLSKAAFRYLERMFSHAFTLHELARVRSNVLLALAKSPNSPLASASSSELVGRFIKDVDTLGERYIRGIFPILNAALGCFVTWVTIALWKPSAGVSVIIAHFLLGWVIPFSLAYVRFQSNSDIQLQQAHLRTQFGNLVLLRNDFISTGTQSINITSFKQDVSRFNNRKHKGFFVQSLQNALSTIGPIILFIVALIFIAQNGDLNKISPADTAAFLFIAFASFELTNSVGTSTETLLESQRAHNHVQSLLKSNIVASNAQRIVQKNITNAAQIENITHRYSNAISAILENFSTTFPLNCATFVKGSSGSGKSTLLNILTGALTPNSGRIVLQSSSTTAARHRDHVFAATLRENLLLGNNAATNTDLEHALQCVELHDWASKLPLGLDTFIGEGGASVSGGERQRILLARALLTQSSLMCIDECTAHLPSHQESAILERLAHNATTKSFVIASHRDTPLDLPLNTASQTITL